MDALRVLLLAGESEAADWVEAGLTASGLSCRARRVPSRTALAAALRGRAPDLILAVPGPAGLDASEARRRTVRRWPESPFVTVPGPELDIPGDGRDVPALSAWLMPAILRALQEADPDWAELAACPNASERLFQALAETLPHLVWTASPGGRCASVNGRWTRFTGLSVETSRDLGWLTALAPEDRAAWREAWAQAQKCGGPFRVECRLRPASGTAPRWHLARALPVRDHNGAIIGWVGTFSDMDEQKRQEETLRASARRHAALAALGRRALEGLEPTALMTEVVTMLVDVLEVDYAAVHELPDAAQPGRVLVESLAENGCLPADYPRDCGAGFLLEQALASGQPVASTDPELARPLLDACRHGEHPAPRGMATPIPGPDGPDGALSAIARRSRPFATEDLHFLQSTAHLIAAARARHRDAHELRAALDAAEDACRAKDRLLSLLGHELRTPLTPILLAVSALQEEPGLPGELRGLLGMIRRNVEIESHLIDDLLDVTRILRGELHYEWSEFDAHEELDRVVATHAPSLIATGLRLEIDRGARPGGLRADVARFRQVLGQLLSNAIKFTPRGGSITIRTRTLPAAHDRPECLRIEFEDTGMGIAPEMLARVFQPFEQCEGVYTRRFGGLGLGLAISKAVAEAHQGRITASSPGPGQGSTFTLDLPTRREPDPLAQSPASTSRGPFRILLVKGEGNHRHATLVKRLRQQGHLVTVADDVATALFAAAARTFDVAVCDLTLPDGAGLALMPRLRARYGLPGIALTDVPLDEAQARAAGFAAWLSRPLSLSSLVASMRQVVRERPGMEEAPSVPRPVAFPVPRPNGTASPLT
jgi:PAS domain S-box-containing protein